MNKIFRNILCVGSAIAVIAFTIDFSILGLASSHRGDKHAYAIPSEPAPVPSGRVQSWRGPALTDDVAEELRRADGPRQLLSGE